MTLWIKSKFLTPSLLSFATIFLLNHCAQATLSFFLLPHLTKVSLWPLAFARLSSLNVLALVLGAPFFLIIQAFHTNLTLPTKPSHFILCHPVLFQEKKFYWTLKCSYLFSRFYVCFFPLELNIMWTGIFFSCISST